MVTLIKATDPVLLSYAQALLSEARIEWEVFDSNLSGLGLPELFASRLMVAEADATKARALLVRNDLGPQLVPESEA